MEWKQCWDQFSFPHTLMTLMSDCVLSKFVDNTKLGDVSSTKTECLQLQTDSDERTDWAQRWQINFDVSKCIKTRRQATT